MTDFETIRIAVDERGVATLTLNRPEQHNALSDLMIDELLNATLRLANDDAVRIVVLTGSGASFCAGGDLGWMQAQVNATRADRIEAARKLALMLKALRDLPKPLIGRVNGQAYGGGVGLISVCDAAIGLTGARFGLTETKLGLIPATISPYVVARIGQAHALRTFTSARLFDAEAARHMGLLHEVVEFESLDAAIEAEIKPYFSTAPAAVAASKRLVHSLGAPIDEAVIEMTLTSLADTWETPEAAEGIAAFFAKLSPSWKRGG
ncbi:crotonase/enoyl-CoA hydratase family protein [Ochrobactrum quorumnocens]|jgi:methylglutaconyl-CoA hydratase|uniref:Crotonase/enoyl-CoA hydratase family protein n=1 Tax=Ochrobactrum quorumnocens TaxID=271865 RepID=A0A5N1JQZ8_9HYPH|nr:crotonase/enoyl-CoA hydratase family protein [[Ochrobactrum] quorumnocens]KAA9366617.1 crotonase/enoyl-CoA hydratase family protein [[Ochrobactrum] quorumnocens]MBD7992506.1 crotonase/enoyl-CoA hydratase family protein [Ochrobactrum gallinarum]